MLEALELIQHTEIKHTITFDSMLEYCVVYGDAQRIEQVVINLLSNATKYSLGANSVEVKLVRDQENVTVGVRDFGPGIDPEKTNWIFTRFSGIGEVTPNISGLGIGLYISHEIITRHSGKIWAESEVGKGSTFYFSLPLANAGT